MLETLEDGQDGEEERPMELEGFEPPLGRLEARREHATRGNEPDTSLGLMVTFFPRQVLSL